MARLGDGRRPQGRGAWWGAAAVVALLLQPAPAGSTARADDLLPPWDGVPPLPAWARSVRVLKGDQPLRSKPDKGSARRGSATRETRLPLFGARRGPGCAGSWLHVGPKAWLCEQDAELSGSPPISPTKPAVTPKADGLPFDYYFAGADGSLAYARIEDVDVGTPVMTLESGFAVAVVEERVLGGERYGRTNRGLWVPMRDFGKARAFAFRGVDIAGAPKDGLLPFAWVVVDRAVVYRKSAKLYVPSGKHRVRFERVPFYEQDKVLTREYGRIGEGEWLRMDDLRHPTTAPAPEEVDVARDERWIDIELGSQTLVAYHGAVPAFATIVSTGKGTRQGHPFETPKGVFRIWVKLVSSTMDNLENDQASNYYRIEDVPYVQYFHKAVGLHAAFWHRKFGHVKSHGCVNLAPLDAAHLFAFTGPRIPAGWTAALPAAFDKGTAIRVR